MGVAVLQVAAEFVLQRLLGEIGDVRGHARDRKALRRRDALVEVAAAAPVRIGHDRLAADLMEGDVLRGMARGGGDRHRGEDALGIGRRPLQDLHAAHRAAGDAEQLVDVEVVEEEDLRAHHVAYRHDGKIEAVRVPCRRIESQAGPVVPMQPPSTLVAMTKYRSVSIGLPGPTIVAHQPFLPVTG